MVELVGGLMVGEDLNCSETVLHAADRVYGLNLPPEALKLAAGFGGGMGIEKTCGGLTGGVMALSAIFVKKSAHEGEYCKELTSEFLSRVTEEMGSLDCDYLKEHYRDDVTGCTPTVEKIVVILEAIIDRELSRG